MAATVDSALGRTLGSPLAMSHTDSGLQFTFYRLVVKADIDLDCLEFSCNLANILE